RTRGRLALSAPSVSPSSGCGTMSAIEWGSSCSDIMASVRGLERIGSLVAHYCDARLTTLQRRVLALTLALTLALALAPVQATHHHDAGERISAARDQVVIDVPVFAGLGQFNGHIPSLREEPEGTSGQQIKAVIYQ